MQAYEAYVENGRVYPVGQITRTPRRLRAIITILDEPESEKKDTWDEFDRIVSEMSEDEKPRFEDFPRFNLGRDLINFEEV